MKKSTWISLIALAFAVTGLIVALAAYFKKKKCVVYDDFDDSLDDSDEYFSAHFDQDDMPPHGPVVHGADEPSAAEEEQDHFTEE